MTKQQPFDALVMAPMAGVTDAPFRLLCAEMGARLCFTEMVSAKGYVISGGGNRQAQALLDVLPGSGATAVQLFGKEPEYFAEAIQRILEEHPHFVSVDINMGCPAPKIAGSGEGSALMKEPALASRIVRAAAGATKKPVSVKMRLGWDEGSINAVNFAKMLQDNGAASLCVHGRTRRQFYAGQANWAEIARVKAAVSIPVYGNGDLFTAGDVLRMRDETGCDGAMIARGATGNPWIFSQIRDALAGRAPVYPSAGQRIALALRHAGMVIGQMGEYLGIREMRKHIAWYLKGLHGATQVRVRVNRIETLAELSECLQDYAAELLAELDL